MSDASALTPLTYAYSKQWDHLTLHFAYYNFCRVHRSLCVTPAMETKVTTSVLDPSATSST